MATVNSGSTSRRGDGHAQTTVLDDGRHGGLAEAYLATHQGPHGDAATAESATLPRDGTATEYVVTNRALVIVSVDVTTVRAGSERTTRYRTRVALDLVDGDWLVASLDEVV